MKLEQLELFENEKITNLKKHIEKEMKRHELWAFLDGHGGKIGYYHGYLQCLRDTEKVLKTMK